MAEKVDINTIDYLAPLSFPEPTKRWVLQKTNAGSNSKKLKLPPADLRGKWIVITGSNNGIGREAAIQFAEWGANLILGCRPNAPKTELNPDQAVADCICKARLAGHQDTEIEWWPIDMGDIASVEAFAKRWNETGRALDILCNNAGMGSSPGGKANKVFKTKDGFEIIHQVNFLSHVLLTLSVLESVKKAKEPRIVCTTSCFHYPGIYDLGDFNGEKNSMNFNGVQYYQNNKLYYQIWLTELQHRLLQLPEYKHITVNGVHPGYVNTGVWNLNGPKEMWKQGAVKILAALLAINAQQGSLAIVNGATSLDAGPDPKVQGVGKEGGKGGGRYFNRIWEEEPMPHTQDQDARLRVWRKCNDELKLEERGLLKVVGLKAMM